MYDREQPTVRLVKRNPREAPLVSKNQSCTCLAVAKRLAGYDTLSPPDGKSELSELYEIHGSRAVCAPLIAPLKDIESVGVRASMSLVRSLIHSPARDESISHLMARKSRSMFMVDYGASSSVTHMGHTACGCRSRCGGCCACSHSPSRATLRRCAMRGSCMNGSWYVVSAQLHSIQSFDHIWVFLRLRVRIDRRGDG